MQNVHSDTNTEVIENPARVNTPRWLLFIDLALVILAFLMVLIPLQIVLIFHIVFVVLAFGAFFWKFRGFFLRALFWVSITTSGVLLAVQQGITQPDEMIEIPLLTAVLLMVYLIASRRTRSQEELEHKSSVLIKLEEDLKSTNRSLENRVHELSKRSFELENARLTSERRAKDLQAIGEISHLITSQQKLDILLPLISQLVIQKLGFYHVGIFLIDDSRQYAVLLAAESEGGKKMLSRGHRLKLGTGIVGNVAESGNPRISLDVGADAVFFNNPDLPGTHSEMALPLHVSGKTIGVLDVQSEIANAFSEADISILSLLADQIAIAIENARLFDESQSALAESQSIFNEYISESWQRKTRSGIMGYRQTLTGGKLITDTTPQTEFETPSVGDGRAIEYPIRVRDQVIGYLNVKAIAADKEWTKDDLNVVQAVTERLGLALDNARLFEETSTRASRERLVTEITTRIRGTNDPEEMIKTAVVELQRALGATRVEILPQKTTPSPDK